MGVGNDGERRVCGVVIHYVCAATGVGDWGVAVGQLDYGGVFCEFSQSGRSGID
jgi:hypothetical protein